MKPYQLGIVTIAGRRRVKWSDGRLTLPPIAGGAPDPDPDPDDDDKKDKPKGDAAKDAEITRLKAEVDKQKGFARKHEDEVKRLKPLADELEALKASGKTDVEKAQEEATAARKEAADIRRELLKTKIAAKHGLSDAQAKRLSGETEEELEADAEEIVEAFGISKRRARRGADPADADDDDFDADDDDNDGTRETAQDRRDRLARRPQENYRPGNRRNADVKVDAKKIVDEVQAKAY